LALEDFTTYTETDPNNHITVTANKLVVDGMSQNEDVYVYADKGESHFGASFEHTLKHTGRGGNDRGMYWAVSNVVDDYAYWGNQDSQALGIEFWGSYKTHTLYGFEENSEDDSWGVWAPTDGTPTYITIKRTSETVLQELLYSDSDRTSLEDTLAVSVVDGRRFRYVFGCVSNNTGSSKTWIDFDVENLDLNEEAPPPGNRRRRVLICGAV